jgi:hypothetical protein
MGKEEFERTGMKRYKIRMFESREGDGSVGAGTVVLPLDIYFSLSADTADEVERKICTGVAEGKLSAGRIYQICPGIGNAELIRSIAIGPDAKLIRVFLDPAKGLYSEFRRIRFPELGPVGAPAVKRESAQA